ncbi:hypothetical protein CPAV1605_538 [seawater metagenome]|uniref:Uncharacterized protein n=1 Tax=seawater metagenome TaxID=1561972 RepID=A0A5E8CHI1_9ZZZZ
MNEKIAKNLIDAFSQNQNSVFTQVELNDKKLKIIQEKESTEEKMFYAFTFKSGKSTNKTIKFEDIGQVIAFSDRPFRETYIFDIEDLVNFWEPSSSPEAFKIYIEIPDDIIISDRIENKNDDSFIADNSNCALYINNCLYIIEISKPKLINEVLEFEYINLPNSNLFPQNFDNGVLFIDPKLKKKYDQI